MRIPSWLLQTLKAGTDCRQVVCSRHSWTLTCTNFKCLSGQWQTVHSKPSLTKVWKYVKSTSSPDISWKTEMHKAVKGLYIHYNHYICGCQYVEWYSLLILHWCHQSAWHHITSQKTIITDKLSLLTLACPLQYHGTPSYCFPAPSSPVSICWSLC